MRTFDEEDSWWEEVDVPIGGDKLKGKLSDLVPGGGIGDTGPSMGTSRGGTTPGRRVLRTKPVVIGVGGIRPGQRRPQGSFSRSTLVRLTSSVGRFNMLRPVLIRGGGSCCRVVTNREE